MTANLQDTIRKRIEIDALEWNRTIVPDKLISFNINEMAFLFLLGSVWFGVGGWKVVALIC